MLKETLMDFKKKSDALDRKSQKLIKNRLISLSIDVMFGNVMFFQTPKIYGGNGGYV